ncbi:thioredoxin family protein [Maribacter sp. 2304DJ31-5]|uniref:thioredoxin family protein n=1 Tax=Maribacter sp. 2304DJ31-5 TaxID=3386273 RepID=UPI0039BD019F
MTHYKSIKKITVLIAFFALSITANAQGIQFFKGTFDEAIAKAKEENKLVFVDFYTTWCGPCKMMSKRVFPQKIVGDYFNEKFVSIKIDAEKGEGIALADTYKVEAYPTLVYINSDKTEKDRFGSATSSGQELVDFSKQVLGEGIDFLAFFENYEKNGNRDLNYVREIIRKGAVYAQGRKDVKEQGRWFSRVYEIAMWYFIAKDPKEMINTEDFKLIAQYLEGPNNGNPTVEYVYDNYDAFKKVAPLEDLSLFVQRTNNQSINESAAKGDLVFRTYVDATKGRLRQAYEDGKQFDEESAKEDIHTTMKYIGEAAYAEYQNDYDAYLDYAIKSINHTKTYRKLDAEDYFYPVGGLLYRISNPELKNAKKTLTESQIKRCHELLAKSLKDSPKQIETLIAQGDLYALENKKDKAIPVYNKTKTLLKGDQDEDYFVEMLNDKIRKLRGPQRKTF